MGKKLYGQISEADRRQSERLEKYIKTKGLSEEAVSLLSLPTRF